MKRKGYRQYSDSTLMSLPKRKIIELLRVAEYNYFVTDEALENSANAGMELAEKLDRHGYWIIIDDVEKFLAKCSECGRVEDTRLIEDYPYCHCGAKMDGGKKND